MRRMLCCTATLAGTQPVLADTANASAISAGSIVQLVVGLVFVVGMVFLCAWLAKRFSIAPGSGNDTLKLLTATAVGQRERIVLVEVGDTWLVIGVAPGQVTALHTLPRAALPTATPQRTPAAGFAPWLSKVMEKRNA